MNASATGGEVVVVRTATYCDTPSYHNSESVVPAALTVYFYGSIWEIINSHNSIP